MLFVPPQPQSGADSMIDQDYKRPHLPICTVGHSVSMHVRGKWRQEKGEQDKEGCRTAFHLYATDFPLPSDCL